MIMNKPRLKLLTGMMLTAALPLFRNTVAGDLVYSALLFGGLMLANKQWQSVAEAMPAVAQP